MEKSLFTPDNVPDQRIKTEGDRMGRVWYKVAIDDDTQISIHQEYESEEETPILKPEVEVDILKREDDGEMHPQGTQVYLLMDNPKDDAVELAAHILSLTDHGLSSKRVMAYLEVISEIRK